MSETFEHRELLHLLWLVPVLGLVFVYGFARKSQALRRFASAHLLGHLTPHVSPGRQRLKGALVLAAAAMLAVAATGPRWGQEYRALPRKGIDLMVALDVSRSMLAQDVVPNRLERAKEELKDLVDVLSGDRIGLVTFAGAASLACPLTINYGAFRMVLDEVDVKSAPRGGTLIGDAVRLAADSFVDRIKEHKAILVITDGEDHESYPVEAARSAYETQGIRVFTIGLGDPRQGARIPAGAEERQYLVHDGQEVWSRMDPKDLEEMAAVAGGAYFGAATRDIDFREVYRVIDSKVRERELEVSQKQVLIPRFMWFAGAALALLMLEILIAERRAPRKVG